MRANVVPNYLISLASFQVDVIYVAVSTLWYDLYHPVFVAMCIGEDCCTDLSVSLLTGCTPVAAAERVI
jgi:hypothetical protein